MQRCSWRCIQLSSAQGGSICFWKAYGSVECSCSTQKLARTHAQRYTRIHTNIHAHTAKYLPIFHLGRWGGIDGCPCKTVCMYIRVYTQDCGRGWERYLETSSLQKSESRKPSRFATENRVGCVWKAESIGYRKPGRLCVENRVDWLQKTGSVVCGNRVGLVWKTELISYRKPGRKTESVLCEISSRLDIEKQVNLGAENRVDFSANQVGIGSMPLPTI